MKASKNQLSELHTLMDENLALKSDVAKRDKARKEENMVIKKETTELKELVNF